LLLVALGTDSDGTISSPFTGPAGASVDASLDVQFWISDTAGPAGLAASSGLQGTSDWRQPHGLAALLASAP
jgi:hypothetical protein